MADRPQDSIELGSAEIPPALKTIADVLWQFSGDDLESQLQTFDMFLQVLAPGTRPAIAAMLRQASMRASDNAVAARIMQASLSVGTGGRAAEPHDHEASMRAYREQHAKNFPNLPKPGGDDAVFLARIEEALVSISAMAKAGWSPAQSIERQLLWCRAFARGEAREERPGPFSMGLIATREFDMYGSEPELASLINEVERLANIRLEEVGEQPPG